MSTKLYDGLQLKGSKADIFEIVKTISSSIEEIFNKQVPKVIAPEIYRIYDRQEERDAAKGLKGFRSTLFHRANNEWEKKQMEMGHRHTLNDPLRFNIVFGKSNKGNILAYPFHRTPQYQKALMDTDLFNDYHYQNQSEHPENLTRKEWRARGKEWDSVLTDSGSHLPSWTLTSRDIFRYGIINEIDYDLAYTQKQRLHNILTDATISAVLTKAQLEGVDIAESNLASFGFISRVSRIASDFVHSDDSEGVALPEIVTDPFVQISELPPVCQPDAATVTEIQRRVEEYYASQS